MSYILGISAYYHDAAAALIKDGEIIAAAQEERFTRIKNDASFPANAIRYCLQQAGILLCDISTIIYYEKPYLKFERILEIFYRYAPWGVEQFIKGIPIWIEEKLFCKRMLKRELHKLGKFDEQHCKLLFSEHHLSHAASAFFGSDFQEAAIITVDGVGEWNTLSIAHGKANQIQLIKEMRFPDSIGLFYSAFTYYLGFKVNSGEYKMMGLAPYADRSDRQTSKFVDQIKQHLLTIHPDGSISLNMYYFSFHKKMRMVHEKRWEQLFQLKPRKAESEIRPEHASLALAAQIVLEEILLRIVQTAQKLTGCSNLCLAGGVALNCVANGKIIRSQLFEHVFIQPAAGDAGGALGAAWATYYIYQGHSRKAGMNGDKMHFAQTGPQYTEHEIQDFLDSNNISYHYLDEAFLYEEVAKHIASGLCIGWFQGRMEFGPRALGNRSILADPRDKEMQKRLNLKIKFRESFRPFAPVILKEKVGDSFEKLNESNYMLITTNISLKHRIPLPKHYQDLDAAERLALPKSDIPAVTHVDFSARVQTVDEQSNPKLTKLLRAFEQLTGYPLLINTSFNVRGEPIVCTPQDAYRCFMTTNLDLLVLGNYIINKNNIQKS